MDKHQDGYPIVLTASRAEANEYDDNPFAAFICTVPEENVCVTLTRSLREYPQ